MTPQHNELGPGPYPSEPPQNDLQMNPDLRGAGLEWHILRVRHARGDQMGLLSGYPLSKIHSG